MTFNIVDQPWLLVSFQDGSMDTVSLRDVFHRAREIEDIQIDFHSERQAVANFLIAVFYRVLTTWDDETSYRDAVYALIDGDIDLGEAFDRYISRDVHGAPLIERFDLFDERYPFLQVPGWESSSPFAISALFSEVLTEKSKSGYANRIASQVSIAELSSLSMQEAVIPLIWAHQGWYSKRGTACYIEGKAPIHPHPKGQERQFHTSGGTHGTFFLAPFLSVIGTNLQNTLILSSPNIPDREDGWTMKSDTAYWELSAEEQSFYGRLTDAARGPADILTYPRSAALLVRDGDRVTGVYFSPNNTVLLKDIAKLVKKGEAWAPEPVLAAIESYEPEGSWEGTILKDAFPTSSMAVQTDGATKTSDSPYVLFHPNSFLTKTVVTKGKGKSLTESVQHKTRLPDAGAAWEGIGALVALGDRSPRIIQWVRELVQYDEIIPMDGVVEVRYTSTATDSGKISRIVSETLYLGSPIARGSFSDEEVPNRIADGVALIVAVRNVLHRLESEISLAYGARMDGTTNQASLVSPYLEGVRPLLESYIAGIKASEKPSDVTEFFSKIVLSESTRVIDRTLSRIPPSLIGVVRNEGRNVARDSEYAKRKIKKMTEGSE